MESNELPKKTIIAGRKYLVVREGRHVEFSVSLTAPYDIDEPKILTKSAGCMIYVLPEIPEGREVQGRDKMEALCHAILAIEARLIGFAQNGCLLDQDGSSAEIDDFGMFFGVIGKQYQAQFGKH